MHILKRLHFSYIVPICLLLAYLVSRSFPFLETAIPLGYDAGLYKSMFLSYTALGASWDFSVLPQWIQTMYEPLLGMWGSLGILIGGGWHDAVLTWGLVFFALLPLGGIRLLARRRGTQAGVFALFFAVCSFTQYEIFWWQYRKQLIGMFLLTVVLWGWERKYWWQMIPVIVGVFLVHKPAAVLLVFGALVRGIVLLFRRQTIQSIELWVSCGVACCLAGPVLVPFRETQFLPLFAIFLQHIDLPIIQDGFQSGGTFLTIREYLLVASSSLLLMLYGFGQQKKQLTHRSLAGICLLIMVVWVFGQGFFFQRMIGYLDIFVLIFASIACSLLRQSGNKFKKALVVVLCVIHVSMFTYRTYRTYRPLIEQNEFAFVAQIGRSIEPNARIIVPGIDYSPRVQGWTQREVLAPGLFDLNRRGSLDQERTTKRLHASAKEKCVRLAQDYPELHNYPLYLWIGSKQPETDLKDTCFVLIEQGAGRSRRKVIQENGNKS